MVVLTVIAILATLAIPSYSRTLEQSQANIAAANLRAVWAAEQWWWLENGTYTPNFSDLQPPTASDPQALGLIDPQLGPATSAISYYNYQLSAGSSSFTASATRKQNPTWAGSFTIDQTGQFPSQYTQSISAARQTPITPAFQ